MAEFSQELFDRICERIAEGESLRAICEDEDMPNKATVMRWLAADAALSDQYARAREAQADTLFEEILEIADDGTLDRKSAGKGDGSLAVDVDHIQRSRLRVEARKWMAGKLRPKVYGDKAVIEGPGENGEHLHKVSPDDAFAAFLAAMGGHAPAPASGADAHGDMEGDGTA